MDFFNTQVENDILGGWLSAFFTLAVFSFLYRDNPVYKVAEHIFVAVGAAYYVTVHMTQTLAKELVQPIRNGLVGESVPGPEGIPWTFRFGALILGALLLARLVPKWSWISRWPLSLLVATFAAIKLTTYLAGDFMGQVYGTMLSKEDWGSGAMLFGNLVLVTGVIAGLIHFLFSIEHKGPVRWISRYGVTILMIAFGSSFGLTVLGRYALFIKRGQDLKDYAGGEYGYASVFLTVLIVGLILLWRSTRRGPLEDAA